MTDRAVSLLRRGWSVVPVHVPVMGDVCSCGNDCSWPGKHPRVAWQPFTEALPSESQVIDWFDNEFYGANLGVVTGQVSDLVVVDVDGTIDDFKALGLPRTRTVLTGGGGYHFFYRTGRQPASSGIGVTPGIDIKADGGFVVLPPSKHVSGLHYEWLNHDKLTKIDVSRLPARAARTASSGGKWIDELLDGVSEGERSSTSARLAGRYAQIGLTIDETVMLLSSWNTLNNPPLSLRELGATISSVYKRHRSRNEIQVSTVDELAELFSDIIGKGLT
ncbi:hypothetical protein LCGC14_1122050 [marine sediment metagenome]|uniref:DNA primase/polymerase bifunctional N-terminal domain-containing protein n=1 Tax=marine sediment metagenome TaxID=412755 RepID=A0A0F9M3M5_9ZZZZ